jgi:hypothetical protein
MSRKARIFLGIGNFCLFAGLSLNLFNQELAPYHSNWFDFLRGFLLGLAITFMFFAARLSRRCSPSQPTNY